MVKLHDLNWKPWLTGDGMRAVYNGYSIIRCPGSYGYSQGKFEIMDLEGEADDVMGYLSVEDVERIINEDRRHRSPDSGK